MSVGAQTLPLYLRRYSVAIDLPSGPVTVASDEQEPNVLRCTFDIQQRAFQIFWTAEITLWNLAESLVSDILSAVEFQHVDVTVQAGYKHSDQGYGIVWQGPIFQPLFQRVGTVDTVLTLHCVLGLGELGRNFISQSFAAGLTQLDITKKIAEQSFTKIAVATLSDKIKTVPLPRGKSVFGPPRGYFTQVAEDNNAQWWFSKDGLTISSLTDSDIPPDPSLTFTPPALPFGNSAGGAAGSFTPGDGIIIGTPQQTPYGVLFRALIDSRVFVGKPFIKIKIDNTQIQKLKQQIGVLPGFLDKNGEYVVVGTHFVGDTRGNDWYVDIDGFTSTGSKVGIMQALQANTNSG